MANEVILLDTSILIDYFRKKDKINSLFLKLSDQYAEFRISVITEFEIYSGAKLEQKTAICQIEHREKCETQRPFVLDDLKSMIPIQEKQ